MKAIVLAGGHATRLWPLTRNRAKPLLPLGGKPIVAYSMDQMEALDAVDEVIVSTNARFAPDFEDFVAENGYEKARIVVEEHQREEEKVGSLGAIVQVLEAEGNDDYLVVGGDNYPAFQLHDFVEAAREAGGIAVACHRVERREDAKQFGVVSIDAEERITGFEEKPEEPPSRLVSTAFYYFPREHLDVFDRYREAHRDVEGALDEPGRLIEWGHERFPMHAYPFEGAWHDIGTPENYLKAQREVSDGFVHGEVADSDLGANVWVMEGATVEGADLENCIVFPEANIVDARCRDTIIDRRAVLKEKDLVGAVVGEYSTIR